MIDHRKWPALRAKPSPVGLEPRGIGGNRLGALALAALVSQELFNHLVHNFAHVAYLQICRMSFLQFGDFLVWRAAHHLGG